MLLFDERTQNSNGCTTETERILRARRFLADCENARKRIEFVRDPDGDACIRARERIACAARQVVLAYRRGDLGDSPSASA